MSPGVKLRSGMILGLLLALGCGKTSSESPVMAGGASAEGGSGGGGEQSEACAPPHFEDPALEAAVRDALGLDADAELTGARAGKRWSLSIYEKVNSLEGIQGLCHLIDLSIEGGPGLTDLSPVASLSLLTNLTISGAGGLSELGPLASLTSLRELSVTGAPITSLEPLRGLTQLKSLDLDDTSVEDIGVVASLGSLTSLSVGRTRVRNLSPLQGLSKLNSLVVSGLALENFKGIPKPGGSNSCMHATELPLASANVAADLEVHCKSGWIIGWSTTDGASGQCNNYVNCFR